MENKRVQRAYLLEQYFATKSYARTQEAFQEKFGIPAPNKSTIKRTVDRFRQLGTCDDGYSTRKQPPRKLTAAKVQEISTRINANHRLSTRRLAVQVGVSRTSVRRTLHKLQLHPYKCSMLQELKPPDYEKRTRFCRWFLRFVREHGLAFCDHVYYSDEAWFHLTGYVNAQNNRYWSGENPRLFTETSLHPQKIGVWCAISRARIIGPIFFEGVVTGEVYRNIIEQFISLLEPDDAYCWFQQDGARCHTSAETMDMLRSFFDDRLISSGLWPPRSPDLSIPDFYLWGYLKSVVYVNNPQTIEQLKQNITDAINAIPVATLKKVFRNAVRRARICVSEAGHHFQQLL